MCTSPRVPVCVSLYLFPSSSFSIQLSSRALIKFLCHRLHMERDGQQGRPPRGGSREGCQCTKGRGGSCPSVGLAHSLMACPVPCLLLSKGRERPDWCQERTPGEHAAHTALSFRRQSVSHLADTSTPFGGPNSPAPPNAQYKALSIPGSVCNKAGAAGGMQIIDIKKQCCSVGATHGHTHERSHPVSKRTCD